MYWRRLGLSGIGGCQRLGSLKGCCVLWLFLNWYARHMRRRNLRKEERSVLKGVLWGVGTNLRPLLRRDIWSWEMLLLVRLMT